QRSETGTRCPQLQTMPVAEVEPIHAVAQRALAEPFAITRGAGVVAAVTRKHYAHVHLVDLLLLAPKPAVDAGIAAPPKHALALPNPLTIRGRQLRPRHIHVHVVVAAELLQHPSFPGGFRTAPRPNG